ncbi:MAG: hypothetical protein ACI4RJ_04400 [Alphaproteobacteria bacterium]
MTSDKMPVDCKYCAKNCPFLEINYLEATEKIPYHCELFDSFLGFDGNVIRCSQCLGEQRSIREEGLNFINAFYDRTINKSVTKISFIKLLPNLQKQFVKFIEKFGKPVGIPNYLDFSKQIGIEKLQHLLMQEMQRKNNQVHYENKEKEELKIILKTQTDAFPDDLDSKTCKLILGLFAVLDVSERAVLIQILKNPNTFSLFLRKLKFMKKDNNLIASVRIELERLKGQAELENASREPARIADVVRKIEIQRVKD